MTIGIEEIDALLPQTQCGECGYAGCLPYAKAIALQKAPLHLCPPGGIKTVQALAAYMGVEVSTAVSPKPKPIQLAVIREQDCIGCTKCIQACPVDAILGAAKRMHVIVASECTGCGLCVEPCPVDCIELKPVEALSYSPTKARARYQAKRIRLLRKQQEKEASYQTKSRLSLQGEDKKEDQNAKKAYILQALLRVQAKKKS